MYTQKAGVESAAHKDRLDYHCCLHKLLLCDLKQSDNNYHLFSLMKSGGSRHWDEGGGSLKIFFPSFRSSVWSKHKGGSLGPQGPPPPVDLPLI